MQRLIVSSERSKMKSSNNIINNIQWRSLLKKVPADYITTNTSLLFLLILILTAAAFVSSLWLTLGTNTRSNVDNETILRRAQIQAAGGLSNSTANNNNNNSNSREETLIQHSKRLEAATTTVVLNCTSNGKQTCSNNYPTETLELEKNEEVCPEYFRWIHEDLRAWKNEKGISREMLEKAKKTADFRLVVKGGKVYVEKYNNKKSIQTRDVFTIWGIIQLLRRYPAKLPDLELMFDCDDKPVIPISTNYQGQGQGGPPPLFRYCGDRWTEDIVFPDWSFWGWAEINIRPWEHLLKDIEKGNKRIKWKDREAYGYWKGNPFVAQTRQDLLKCNVSRDQDWNARLFVQDWIQESHQGFNNSNVANQCTHRYKIYIEGYAWSVSEKYILACDSVTLLVKPRFYDFFIRSLQPLKHYWPISDTHKCKSIKHAVDWGNKHTQKVQEIGKAGSNFIQQELKMDNVYDYMFHLLNEYAKLLKFEAEVPEGAVEVCAESMACSKSSTGLEKKFMIESMVMEPSTKPPCSMPPPFDPTSLRIFYATKLNLINRVQRWEDNYWKKYNTAQ